MSRKCSRILTAFGALAMISFLPIDSSADDSTCVRFLGGSEHTSVELRKDYVLGGVLPLTLCGIERDVEYRFVIDGPGQEKRVGTFSIEKGKPSIKGLGLALSAKNALVPGWGSFDAERRVAASVDLLALGAVTILLWGEQQEYEDLEDKLEAFREAASNAENVQELSHALIGEHETIRRLNVQNEHRKNLLMLGAAIYALQAIEPLWNDLAPKARNTDDMSLVLMASEKSRGRAFLRSLLLAGRGQFYQDKPIRGVTFSILSLGAGLCALEFHNRFEKASCDYELCIESFQDAGTVEEKEALAMRCSELFEEAQTQRDRRTISLAVLAAAWSLSCIDTFFDDAGTSSSGLSLDVGRGNVAITFRF